MTEDDELRYLFARAFEGATPTDECPPPEDLLDALQGRSPEPRRLEVIDHLAVCAVCADAWRLAKLHLSDQP
jgi:hypothetical protein